jgi:hypothetical protein
MLLPERSNSLNPEAAGTGGDMWGRVILTAVIVVLVAIWLAAIWFVLTGSPTPFWSKLEGDKSELEAYVRGMVLRTYGRGRPLNAPDAAQLE